MANYQIIKPRGRGFVPWASLLLSHLLNGITLHQFSSSGFQLRLGRGRFHEAADLFHCTSLHLIGDMRIGVEGDPGTEMAQHIEQCLHIHTAGEGHRGESMAQIMEANTLLNARLRHSG